LTEIVGIRFNNRGKIYYFDPAGIKVNQGENVIVETAKGLEYGECARGNYMVDDESVIQPLRPVVRVATSEDNKSYQAGKDKEKEAFNYCQKKIEDFGLEMKLVNVEYGFEGNKILFFFTSEGRVDFRELVKDLAGMFRARIELRQIGVRDEAKMLGGLGVCGKVFCCSQFLTEFHPVSIKMAKTQGLSLNPTKISGTCGRLMCCLKYEEAAYEDLVKKAPKNDAFVETPAGKGTVINVNLLRGNAKVRLEEGLDTTLKTFNFDELDVLGGKGRRAEYIAAKAEGRLEEAGFTVTPPPAPAMPKMSLDNSRPSGGDNRRQHQPKQQNPSGGKNEHRGPRNNNHGNKNSEQRKGQQASAERKGQQQQAHAERNERNAEKTLKPNRPQPSESTHSKKTHPKRRRNNRGGGGGGGGGGSAPKPKSE